MILEGRDTGGRARNTQDAIARCGRPSIAETCGQEARQKAAAEALAVAERMRPVMVELGALSANRAAAVLNRSGRPAASRRVSGRVTAIFLSPSVTCVIQHSL